MPEKNQTNFRKDSTKVRGNSDVSDTTDGTNDTNCGIPHPAWHETVRELTDGQGVDRVIEVGGAGTFEQSIKSTTVSGQISLVGRLANTASTINVSALTGNFFTLRRIALGNRAHFLAMHRAIAVNRLKPVIDHVFSFDDARVAHQYFSEHPHFGKVVISQS